MSFVTILWSAVAAGSVVLGLMHTVLWLFDRRAFASLAFAVMAFATAGIAAVELGLMTSQTAVQFGTWVRWVHVPLFFQFVAMLVFLRLYLGTGKAWLMWSLIALRCLIVVANFHDPHSGLVRVDSITRIGFLGEQISILGHAVPTPWQVIATLSNLLAVWFMADASISLWRRGTPQEREKALVVGGSIAFFWLTAAVFTQLVLWRVLIAPTLIAPFFMITLAAMAFEMSRDLLRASRLSRERDELRSELAHTSRVTVLGQLASTFAHELRQPLTAILANVTSAQYVLESQRPNLQTFREITDDIYRDGRRAAEFIERLNVMLRRRPPEFQPVAVDGLLRDTTALLRLDASAKGVSLETIIEAASPVVMGDRVHLSQVLINLIINAMDAVTDMPAPRRRVTARVRANEHRAIEIAVSDRGAGITDEAATRLFEPFFTTKASGMGVGLSVSRNIIELHGGRLWAENNTDGGATFLFSIPAGGQQSDRSTDDPRRNAN